MGGRKKVHLITTMIKWIRTSRLSIKNSLSGGEAHPWSAGQRAFAGARAAARSSLSLSLSLSLFLLLSLSLSLSLSLRGGAGVRVEVLIPVPT